MVEGGERAVLVESSGRASFRIYSKGHSIGIISPSYPPNAPSPQHNSSIPRPHRFRKPRPRHPTPRKPFSFRRHPDSLHQVPDRQTRRLQSLHQLHPLVVIVCMQCVVLSNQTLRYGARRVTVDFVGAAVEGAEPGAFLQGVGFVHGKGVCEGGCTGSGVRIGVHFVRVGGRGGRGGDVDSLVFFTFAVSSLGAARICRFVAPAFGGYGGGAGFGVVFQRRFAAS